MATKNTVQEFLSEFLGDMQKSASENVPVQEDPRNSKVTSGSRASENESDVKAQIPGESVNEGGEITSTTGGENTPTNSIGTKKGPTGTDVPSTKSTKDDPGTSHIAKAAAAKFAGATTSQLVEGANELLAQMAVMSKSASAGLAASTAATKPASPAATVSKVAPVSSAVTPVVAANKPEVKTAAATNEVPMVQLPKAEFELMKVASDNWAAFVGYVEGQNIADQALKVANDTSASDQLEKFAQEQTVGLYQLAEKAATDLTDFFVGAQKQANDLAALGMGGGGEDPAAAAAASGQIDPSALGGAGLGGAGGEMPSPDAGMNLGGMGGGAGAPPAPPGAGGGEISPELIQALIQALQQSGVNLQDLGAGDQALSGMGGGGNGGAAPAPAAAAPAEEASEGGEDKSAPAESKPADKIDKAKASAVGSEAGSSDESDDSEKEAAFKKIASTFAKFLKVAGENARKNSNKKK